jgi:hypothetical protein
LFASSLSPPKPTKEKEREKKKNNPKTHDPVLPKLGGQAADDVLGAVRGGVVDDDDLKVEGARG